MNDDKATTLVVKVNMLVRVPMKLEIMRYQSRLCITQIVQTDLDQLTPSSLESQMSEADRQILLQAIEWERRRQEVQGTEDAISGGIE